MGARKRPPASAADLPPPAPKRAAPRGALRDVSPVHSPPSDGGAPPRPPEDASDRETHGTAAPRFPAPAEAGAGGASGAGGAAADEPGGAAEPAGAPALVLFQEPPPAATALLRPPKQTRGRREPPLPVPAAAYSAAFLNFLGSGVLRAPTAQPKTKTNVRENRLRFQARAAPRAAHLALRRGHRLLR
jgi:hypothetical protein